MVSLLEHFINVVNEVIDEVEEEYNYSIDCVDMGIELEQGKEEF